jgi:hypothetical protein
MALPRALKTFASYSDPVLASFFAGVALMLTGNVHFLALQAVVLPALQTGIDDYVSALNGSVTRTAGTAALKNQKKLILVNLGRSLVDDVNGIAKGDLAKLNTTGLEVWDGISSPRILGSIEFFKAVRGKNTCTVDLSVKAENARGAMYSYTPDPLTAGSVWKSDLCTELTCTISNLTAGEKLWFQSKVIGSNGQFLISDPIMVIVT